MRGRQLRRRMTRPGATARVPATRCPRPDRVGLGHRGAGDAQSPPAAASAGPRTRCHARRAPSPRPLRPSTCARAPTRPWKASRGQESPARRGQSRRREHLRQPSPGDARPLPRGVPAPGGGPDGWAVPAPADPLNSAGATDSSCGPGVVSATLEPGVAVARAPPTVPAETAPRRAGVASGNTAPAGGPAAATPSRRAIARPCTRPRVPATRSSRAITHAPQHRSEPAPHTGRLPPGRAPAAGPRGAGRLGAPTVTCSTSSRHADQSVSCGHPGAPTPRGVPVEPARPPTAPAHPRHASRLEIAR